MCLPDQDAEILLLDTAIRHVKGKHVNISVLIWILNAELKPLMYENSSLGTDKKGFNDNCNIPNLFLLCLLHCSLKKYMQENCFHQSHFAFWEAVKSGAQCNKSGSQDTHLPYRTQEWTYFVTSGKQLCTADYYYSVWKKLVALCSEFVYLHVCYTARIRLPIDVAPQA